MFYSEEEYGFYQPTIKNQNKYRKLSFLKLINRTLIKFTFGKNIFLSDRPGKKLLDIGCATGNYLSLMKTRGWKVKGIEPSKKACQIGKKTGLDIINSDLQNAKINDTFDLITMRHVIEHFEDPFSELKKINKLLVKNGILIIATPNVSSWEFKLFNKNWGAFEVPRHLFLFNKQTLSKLLRKTGFKVIDIKKEIYPASSLIGINKMFPRITFITKSRIFFWAFAIFYSIISRLIGNGRMIVIAKKF
jgi:2-polyprenyl-3-methyl-5-hydroxy-6-metoxy-1,4-benzoquinol methylase